MPENPTSPLLSVEHVTVRLHGVHRATSQIGGKRILNDVSLTVGERQIVGLIGETGSGKTTLARAIVGLVKPVGGDIHLEGQEISRLKRRELRALRRRGAMQFVFQDPLRSLDPDMTVRDIVGEGLAIRGAQSPAERERAIESALRVVGLEPEVVLDRRPGQISGGQRQRVSIARAVVMGPKLLLCDEPVSALDASTRNYVLRILSNLRDELGLSLLVISHDLASLAGVAERVAVLYRGHVVEEGPLDAVFASAAHPYTALLIASAPSLGRGRTTMPIPVENFGRTEVEEDLDVAGDPFGCPFASRCPYATDVCLAERPQPVEVWPDWTVACHHADSWRLTLPTTRPSTPERVGASDQVAVATAAARGRDPR
jgi:oligopeptide/dipeptide ABC transporter ATP-binding protein